MVTSTVVYKFRFIAAVKFIRLIVNFVVILLGNVSSCTAILGLGPDLGVIIAYLLPVALIRFMFINLSKSFEELESMLLSTLKLLIYSPYFTSLPTKDITLAGAEPAAHAPRLFTVLNATEDFATPDRLSAVAVVDVSSTSTSCTVAVIS